MCISVYLSWLGDCVNSGPIAMLSYYSERLSPGVVASTVIEHHRLSRRRLWKQMFLLRSLVDIQAVWSRGGVVLTAHLSIYSSHIWQSHQSHPIHSCHKSEIQIENNLALVTNEIFLTGDSKSSQLRRRCPDFERTVSQRVMLYTYIYRFLFAFPLHGWQKGLSAHRVLPSRYARSYISMRECYKGHSHIFVIAHILQSILHDRLLQNPSRIHV